MLWRVSAYLGPILPKPTIRYFFMGSVSCKWGLVAPKSLWIRFSTPKWIWIKIQKHPHFNALKQGCPCEKIDMLFSGFGRWSLSGFSTFGTPFKTFFLILGIVHNGSPGSFHLHDGSGIRVQNGIVVVEYGLHGNGAPDPQLGDIHGDKVGE